jgi:hypothetical protein
MYKKPQQENEKTAGKQTSRTSAEGWEGAIAVAKRKIKHLQSAIRAFEIYRDAGEPWPGTEEASGSETVNARRLHQASE